MIVVPFDGIILNRKANMKNKYSIGPLMKSVKAVFDYFAIVGVYMFYYPSWNGRMSDYGDFLQDLLLLPVAVCFFL